jgi:hypothetical protein
MSPFPLPFEQVLEDCAAEPGRVRPIGEILTSVLAKYELTAEPASVASRTWVRVDLGHEHTMAPHALGVLVD